MARRHLLACAAAVGFLSWISSSAESTAGRFDVKLSPDRQIEQVLNRLTFGPRPGDADEVRRMGIEKWIATELHPERISENAAVAQHVDPLDTLSMDTAALFKLYYPPNPPGIFRFTPINELLAQDQIRKVMNGTAEERTSALNALDPDRRAKVLASLPLNVTDDLPDLKKEAAAARQKRTEETQMQLRKQRPPLSDLLTQPEQQIALRGTLDQKKQLFASLDPEKLRKLAGVLPPASLADLPELRRLGVKMRSPQQLVIGDLREAKLYRAIYSNRQLEEVLVDFWFNHFNVYEAKDRERPLLANYERDAIRPHVLGKFKDLLLATARHPAMLNYLDNWESMSPEVFQLGPFAPGPFAAAQQLARQARGINENYGREVMELHTMGVNGGYTQKDVIDVARCFTGWTIRDPNTKPAFAFAAFMHDTGEKHVLGHDIPAGGGEQDGLLVIDIMAHHPSTAKFISMELARHFVADTPPPALVDRMAKVFFKTDGDLRAVLEAMFTSREFLSEGAWMAKVKSPFETVVSAVRALGAEPVDASVLVQKVADMGEPLYGKVEPTGYRDTADQWLSTASVVARLAFANALTNGSVPGVKVDTTRFGKMEPPVIARELLNRPPAPETLTALEKGIEGRQSTPRLIAGLVLASPDFQRR